MSEQGKPSLWRDILGVLGLATSISSSVVTLLYQDADTTKLFPPHLAAWSPLLFTGVLTFAIVAPAGIAVILFWPSINRLRSSTRFKELVNAIGQCEAQAQVLKTMNTPRSYLINA